MPPVHEKLRVYQKALQIAVRAEEIAISIPLSRRDLQDPLRRASASIPLNIAEGANEFSAAEKSRSYRIARRSCAECQAIYDLPAGMRFREDEVAREKIAVTEVTAMLTRMILNRAQDRSR